jgi:hypothetical protein
MFKFLANKLLYRYLNSDVYDEEEKDQWLDGLWDNTGFKSYYKERLAVLHKSIATAVDTRDFQKALEVNGRRKELLRLAARAQEKNYLNNRSEQEAELK